MVPQPKVGFLFLLLESRSIRSIFRSIRSRFILDLHVLFLTNIDLDLVSVGDGSIFYTIGT